MENIHVLLIEENTVDINLIDSLLKENKIRVSHIQVFNRVHQFLEEKYVDIILLGLSSSNSKNIKTLEDIQKIARKLPIIILMSLDNEEIACKVLKCGAQDYLIKRELNGKQLYRAIRYSIKRKQGEFESRTKEVLDPEKTKTFQEHLSWIENQFKH